MDSILPALFALVIILLASLMMGRSGFTSFQVLSEAWQDAEERAIERLRSDITITSITVTNAGADVDVVVRNDGETPVVDFARMDLVVQYSDGTGSRTVWVPYTDPPLLDNTWTVLVVTDDVIDPGVLNAGESMTIRVRLNPPVGTGTNNWLQVTTELGISASRFFTN